jgi:hypothetical protein
MDGADRIVDVTAWCSLEDRASLLDLDQREAQGPGDRRLLSGSDQRFELSQPVEALGIVPDDVQGLYLLKDHRPFWSGECMGCR